MITIVDYGMGNLRSVFNALTYIGVDAEIRREPDAVAESLGLILPGVGSFTQAMRSIQDRGLFTAIRYAALERGVPILGICLGMQLLAEWGTEDGCSNGLGLIAGSVERMEPNHGCKVPHVGFNEVHQIKNHPLWNSIIDESHFYFVHSYHFKPEIRENIIGVSNYGNTFVCAISCNNISGVQFHPEKSQSNGLQLLRNFSSSISVKL